MNPENANPDKMWKTLDQLLVGAGAIGGRGVAGIMGALRQVKKAYDSLPPDYKPGED